MKSTDILLSTWYLWQLQEKPQTQTLLIFLFPCSTPSYSLANAICGMLPSNHPHFISELANKVTVCEGITHIVTICILL